MRGGGAVGRRDSRSRTRRCPPGRRRSAAKPSTEANTSSWSSPGKPNRQVETHDSVCSMQRYQGVRRGSEARRSAREHLSGDAASSRGRTREAGEDHSRRRRADRVDKLAQAAAIIDREPRGGICRRSPRSEWRRTRQSCSRCRSTFSESVVRIRREWRQPRRKFSLPSKRPSHFRTGAPLRVHQRNSTLRQNGRRLANYSGPD
jgi:hypothetical protein